MHGSQCSVKKSALKKKMDVKQGLLQEVQEGDCCSQSQEITSTVTIELIL